MSNEVLKATERTLIGTNAVRKLRTEHFVPGVLYGHHIDSQPIKIDLHDFEKFYKHHNIGASLDLDVDGKKTFVLLKDVQYNTLKRMVVHAEFQALSKGEKIKIKVPVHYLNKDAIPAGLIFQELHHEIEMHVLPKDLIEQIDIDLTGAEHGEGLKIGDLDVFKNDAFDILEHPDTLLYTVSEAKVQVEEDTEEETVDPAEVPEVGEE